MNMYDIKIEVMRIAKNILLISIKLFSFTFIVIGICMRNIEKIARVRPEKK
jgi:hypothetical protein